MRPVIVFAAFVAFAFGASCNDSNFAGNSNKKAAEKKQNKPTPDDKDTDDTDENALGNKKPGSGKPNDPNLEDTSDEGNIDVPGTTDQANNKPDTTLVDLLNGLVNSDTNIAVNQPNDNEVEFGPDTYFHIGDGQLSGSTCKVELGSGAKGVKFFFEFEVKKDGTNVELFIKKMCGVDYSSSNFIKIVKSADGSTVTEQPIPKEADGVADAVETLATPVTIKGTNLAAGKYAIFVESRPHDGSEQANSVGDRDDFVVGYVGLKADKPIKAGAAGVSKN